MIQSKMVEHRMLVSDEVGAHLELLELQVLTRTPGKDRAEGEI